MAKGDFGNKRNTAGFDKNPQNINKNGENRKSFASINKELMAKGVQKLTKKDLIAAYELIFNTDEESLLKLAKNDKTPYGLKLIILELNKSSTRSKALADYRDYMFGRATENKVLDITVDEITPEERVKRLKLLKDKIRNEE